MKYVAAILIAMAIALTPFISSVANADNPPDVPLPFLCTNYNEGTEFVHTLTLSPEGPLKLGDSVDITVTFSNTLPAGSQTEQITEVILALFDPDGDDRGTSILSNPEGLESPLIEGRGNMDKPGTWTVIACYRGPDGTTVGLDTLYVDVATFFVLPESPIGVAALVASSLGVLGGFMFLKRRNNSNMPI